MSCRFLKSWWKDGGQRRLLLTPSVSVLGLPEQRVPSWVAYNSNNVSSGFRRRSPKSRCQHSHAPWDAPSDAPSTPPLAPGGPKCSLARGCIPPVSVSVATKSHIHFISPHIGHKREGKFFVLGQSGEYISITMLMLSLPQRPLSLVFLPTLPGQALPRTT